MADEQNTNWDYSPSGSSDTGTADAGDSPAQQENISWTAKEFIEHDRNSGWYMMLILGSGLIAVIIYFITKDIFAVGATIVVGVIAAVYAGHKPKELDYELNGRSIKVGPKSFNYSMFKSFSIAHEGAHTSIVLEPIKRYLPTMTLYFPPENEKVITNVIGNHLPLQDHEPTVTERLAHRFKL
jgi:hypothetical protein